MILATMADRFNGWGTPSMTYRISMKFRIHLVGAPSPCVSAPPLSCLVDLPPFTEGGPAASLPPHANRVASRTREASAIPPRGGCLEPVRLLFPG